TCDGVNVTSPAPGLCRCVQRIGAISVGSWRPAQAAKLDEGPDADAEADDMQDDESHVLHPVAGSAQDSRRRVKDEEPPRGLVAVVEPLGADGVTDPDQRDVENDEESMCKSSELDIELLNQEHSKQEQYVNELLLCDSL